MDTVEDKTEMVYSSDTHDTSTIPLMILNIVQDSSTNLVKGYIPKT